MREGENRLAEMIMERIRREGPITFSAFMELALYHPEYGYYTSDRRKIGRAGDFYTSPTVSPFFAEMLAVRLREMWQRLGRPAPFVVAEYGAGTGTLARDFLGVAERDGEFWEAITYLIVEVSPGLCKIQEALLGGVRPGKVAWAGEHLTAGVIPDGCVIVNELVDAFPVHRLWWTVDGRPEEIYVDCRAGHLVEMIGPLSTPALADYLAEMEVSGIPGQIIEVNLAALDWLAEVAAALGSGFVVTIDYGGLTAEVHHPARSGGTLRCFYRHTLNTDPYRHIGAQDITASVDFSALMRRGERYGLHVESYQTQAEFLVRSGILERLRGKDDYRYDPQHYNTVLAVKKLILPEGMGSAFKVLVQSKGL